MKFNLYSILYDINMFCVLNPIKTNFYRFNFSNKQYIHIFSHKNNIDEI